MMREHIITQHLKECPKISKRWYLIRECAKDKQKGQRKVSKLYCLVSQIKKYYNYSSKRLKSNLSISYLLINQNIRDVWQAQFQWPWGQS